MKISTKGRYSLRILLDLAEHRDEGFISLKTVAQRQGISKGYLDQIMMLFSNTDYLKTVRGAQGGYQLAKEPKDYTLGNILRLTEGSITPLTCLEEGVEKCERHDSCKAHSAWKGLEEVMTNYLDNLTLQDILDQNGGKVPADFSL